jgi:hypothetical protein
VSGPGTDRKAPLAVAEARDDAAIKALLTVRTPTQPHPASANPTTLLPTPPTQETCAAAVVGDASEVARLTSANPRRVAELDSDGRSPVFHAVASTRFPSAKVSGWLGRSLIM